MMRFGISERPGQRLSALLRTDCAVEELEAAVADYDRPEGIRSLHAAGFAVIELGSDMKLFFPDVAPLTVMDRLAALRDELSLTYTVHLPLWSNEPSTPVEEVRAGSVASIIGAIGEMEPLQPQVYVLHATGALGSEFARRPMPATPRAFMLSRFQDQARRSMDEVLNTTGLASRRLAIETVEFPFEMTLALAEEFDLSMCFDVGHVLVGYSGPIDVFDALAQSIDRVAEIHLHDGDWQGPDHIVRSGKDHQRLGEGDLDVPRFIDYLDVASFGGPLVFELSVENAVASLDHIRNKCPNAITDQFIPRPFTTISGG